MKNKFSYDWFIFYYDKINLIFNPDCFLSWLNFDFAQFSIWFDTKNMLKLKKHWLMFNFDSITHLQCALYQISHRLLNSQGPMLLREYIFGHLPTQQPSINFFSYNNELFAIKAWIILMFNRPVTSNHMKWQWKYWM